MRQWSSTADLNCSVILTKDADRRLSLSSTTLMEPGRRIELRYAGYESAALPIELTRPLTGASSQSLTGFPGIQILRIDGNAYEAILTQRSAWIRTRIFRQLGAVYQTRTGVCRLAVCRPGHWTNTANLWSGVRESNPSYWFGRPEPKALGQLRLNTLILSCQRT